VILAHAKAVKTFREKYQKTQGGTIGICLNTDYGEPYDPSSQDDIDAVNTMLEFSYGWYQDPLYFGKYPDSMVELVTDNRLPSFTEEESEMVKGSFDFLGLNHYTSKFIHYSGEVGRDHDSDGRYWASAYNIYGEIIGPVAGVFWLNVYPQGIRKLLNWIDKRYDHHPIYVFENGVSVPGENELAVEDAVHDQFRLDYYKDYIQNVEWAIEDGVDVVGYFAWSLMDNFEWTDGYSIRFGMVYIDYENDQKRYIKDSANWYSDLISSHK